MKRIILLLPVVLALVLPVSAQFQSSTYAKTRILLLRMELPHDHRILKKLFEESGERKADLIHALYDSDEKVSLNSQVIIRYVADLQMLTALDDWYKFRQKHGQDYWKANVEQLSELQFLDRSDRDPAKAVLKSLYPTEKDARTELVAFDKRTETALVEVVFMGINAGRHVAVRKENDRWRLLSNPLVWES